MINVVSYNIWFDDKLSLKRTLSLANTVQTKNPDIICLQEVIPEVHDVLKLLLKDYKFCFPQKITKNYDCVIFSKYPIKKCLVYPYKNSTMGRCMTVIQINFNNIDIVFANTHFESLFKKTEPNKEKIKQYEIGQQILETLYNTYKNVILCTDTNVLDHEEHYFNSIYLDNGWTDAWMKLGNENNKYTYDSEKNIHLNNKFYKTKYMSRIDRILAKGDNCKLLNFDIIKGIILEPSDHFGVCASYKIE